MAKKNVKAWIKKAMNASDLMQGYIDLVSEKIDELMPESRQELHDALADFSPRGPEEAAAKAIILYILSGA